jgi:hypothetical protein
MLVDTKGLTKELEGKTLRIRFNDGCEQVIKLEWVLTHDCHESCNGFIYKSLSTNQPEKLEEMRRKYPNGFSSWGNFQDIVSCNPIEEGQSK